MRKLTLIPLLSLIFILSVASTCSSDDSPNSSADPAPVINTVTSGTWTVTFFEDDGVDETYHFTGYNFTFGASNVLTATNGTNTYTGTWSVTNDDSNDDSPSSSGLDFNIFLVISTLCSYISQPYNIFSLICLLLCSLFGIIVFNPSIKR